MSVPVLADLRAVAEDFWPVATAESWDQVGLVTGRDGQPIKRVLLAVDAVAATVDEAIAWGADALITHHPLLLRGIHTVAEDTAKGALLARLIRAECALIAAHTNADAPEYGVSDVIAQRLGLLAASPIEPGADPTAGIGRVGDLVAPVNLREFADRVNNVMPQTVSGVRVAGDPERKISRVALCGGAGDSLLSHPAVLGADVYVTSDLRHHPAQEAIGNTNHRLHPRLVQVIEEFTQRHMGGDMDNLELIGIQHHREIFGLRQMSQHFGMPWEMVPGQMQRLFI